MDDNQQLLPPPGNTDTDFTDSQPITIGDSRRNAKGQFGPGNSANNSGRPPTLYKKLYDQFSVLVSSLLEESAPEIKQAAIAEAPITEAMTGNALAIEPLPHASHNSRAGDADPVNSSNRDAPEPPARSGKNSESPVRSGISGLQNPDQPYHTAPKVRRRPDSPPDSLHADTP